MSASGEPDRVCADCGAPFAIPPARLRALRERGLPPPTRCEPCRVARRAERNARRAASHDSFGPVAGDGAASAPGEDSGRLHPAVCDACGRDTRIPFPPRLGRPVYCRSCFAARRGR
jgi:CxxC-x17-CxxC domain-containing protein